MLAGTIDWRKSSHEPEWLGACAPAVPMVAWAPGLVISPITMPIVTAISEVMANQTRVCTASLAALVTWRRLAIDTITAVSTNGTTTTRSRSTKTEPTVVSVVVSQLSSKRRAR